MAYATIVMLAAAVYSAPTAIAATAEAKPKLVLISENVIKNNTSYEKKFTRFGLRVQGKVSALDFPIHVVSGLKADNSGYMFPILPHVRVCPIRQWRLFGWMNKKEEVFAYRTKNSRRISNDIDIIGNVEQTEKRSVVAGPNGKQHIINIDLRLLADSHRQLRNNSLASGDSSLPPNQQKLQNSHGSQHTSESCYGVPRGRLPEGFWRLLVAVSAFVLIVGNYIIGLSFGEYWPNKKQKPDYQNGYYS